MQVVPLTDGISANQLVSPREPRFWDGIRQFVADSGSDRLRQSTQIVDGIIPSERLIGYDPNVTIAESSRISENDLGYLCFGADRSVDPRAKTRRRYEIEVAGEVSEWCCGVDSATMDMAMRAFDYKRGWFGISKDICWTDEMERQYSNIFDPMAMYRQLATTLLEKAATEIAFYGHEIYDLHGVKDLPVQRARLDTPFDQMNTVEDAYAIWVALKNDNALTRGDLGVEKTHMIAPRAWRALRSQIRPSSVTETTLGELMDRENRLQTKYTDYMNFAGSDGNPALFLYARNSGMIVNDYPFAPFMLPPEYNRGKLRLQWVARYGELFATNPNAALVVENAFTAAA
jgi:hypothetical protein